MNHCEYCGKPCMFLSCSDCYAMRDPELSADRLTRAILQHPERAQALHQALIAPSSRENNHVRNHR